MIVYFQWLFSENFSFSIPLPHFWSIWFINDPHNRRLDLTNWSCKIQKTSSSDTNPIEMHFALPKVHC